MWRATFLLCLLSTGLAGAQPCRHLNFEFRPCQLGLETETAPDPGFDEVPLAVFELRPATSLQQRLLSARQTGVSDPDSLRLTGARSEGSLEPAGASPAPGLDMKIESSWARMDVTNQGAGLDTVRGSLEARTPDGRHSLTFATVYGLAINGKTTTTVHEMDWVYQWKLSPVASLRATRAVTGIESGNETETYRADLQLHW